MGVYRSLLRALLFRIDAERVHAAAIHAAELAGSSNLLLAALERRNAPTDPRLAVDIAGLRFRTPLGLAAGLVAPARFVSGFAVNLPAGKPEGLMAPAPVLAAMPGAVSGAPAAIVADRTIRELFVRMDRARYRLIGSGGVFSADDAYRKIRLGASLVQLLTALVYEGPGIAATIHRGLARLLERDGFAQVSDAVGVDAGSR